jgi:hypothetical protein
MDQVRRRTPIGDTDRRKAIACFERNARRLDNVCRRHRP